MKNVKSATFFLTLLVACSSCEDPFMTRQEPATPLNKTVLDQNREGIDDFTDHPDGQTVPYPAIIKKTFIPSNVNFANMKCLTWRISWPTYAAGTDPEKIATVFRTSNGALNSIDYLNNTDPQNTLNANFSLYHNDKLEAAVTMWEELDHNDPTIEPVVFKKVSYPLALIEFWVKERPQLFAINWTPTNQMETSYQAGDIFLYKLVNQNLHGGIRIVSMSPRVIEVYLAVPTI